VDDLQAAISLRRLLWTANESEGYNSASSMAGQGFDSLSSGGEGWSEIAFTRYLEEEGSRRIQAGRIQQVESRKWCLSNKITWEFDNVMLALVWDGVV